MALMLFAGIMLGWALTFVYYHSTNTKPRVILHKHYQCYKCHHKLKRDGTCKNGCSPRRRI